jgi:hypothetical protein
MPTRLKKCLFATASNKYFDTLARQRWRYLSVIKLLRLWREDLDCVSIHVPAIPSRVYRDTRHSRFDNLDTDVDDRKRAVYLHQAHPRDTTEQIHHRNHRVARRGSRHRCLRASRGHLAIRKRNLLCSITVLPASNNNRIDRQRLRWSWQVTWLEDR